VKIYAYCGHCGGKLAPSVTRCQLCNRLARLSTPLGVSIATGFGVATAAWSAYKGNEWGTAVVLGIAMVLAILVCGLTFRSKPLPYSEAGFSKTWVKELLFGWGVGLMIMALAVVEMLEPSVPWYGTLLPLVLGSTVIAVVMIPFRSVMWFFAPSVARCESCGAGMSIQANFCSICGTPQRRT
jgi:peptidoglycan/LPS O-acetylase OafA/YrhL